MSTEALSALLPVPTSNLWMRTLKLLLYGKAVFWCTSRHQTPRPQNRESLVLTKLSCKWYLNKNSESWKNMRSRQRLVGVSVSQTTRHTKLGYRLQTSSLIHWRLNHQENQPILGTRDLKQLNSRPLTVQSKNWTASTFTWWMALRLSVSGEERPATSWTETQLSNGTHWPMMLRLGMLRRHMMLAWYRSRCL